MNFRDLKEIEKYYSKQLKSGNSAAFDFLKDQGGIPVVSENELENAARMFKQYLQNHLKDYFDSYSPVIYDRTGDFIDSIEIDMSNTNGKLSALIYFDEDKAIRNSLWNGQPQGDLAVLLDQGWHVKSGWHKDIPHFGYFEGIGFIDAAVEDALKDKQFSGIQIDITF